jgi:hypothetical protein
LLLVFPLSVLAIDKKCLLSKYEEYASVQETWQKDVTELITLNNTELKEVADLYLNDQLLLIRKGVMAVTMLLDLSPEKLNSGQTVNRWLQLEASDDNELAKQSAAYNQLLEDYSANQNREPHKNGDKLREIMRTQIVPSKDFKLLYSNFSDKVRAINNTVCSAI